MQREDRFVWDADDIELQNGNADETWPVTDEDEADFGDTFDMALAKRTTDKQPQSAVEYIDHANNPATTCLQCAHFIADGNTCALVEGAISPNGWCNLFEAEAPTKTALTKATGVDPADDEYAEAPISREFHFDFPASNHVNELDIVASVPDGLPPKPFLFKPHGGERDDLNEYIGGPQYLREAAAYILDRSLSLYLVPVAYVAESYDEEGAAVMYTDGAQPPYADVNQYAPEWVERAAVFDYISGQVDRGTKHNYLTASDDLSRPVLVDNGLTFGVKPPSGLESPFTIAWAGVPLSTAIQAAIVQCIGDASGWFDIRSLVGAVASGLALERAKQLRDEKVIPNETTSTANGSSGL
jgi:hypothetical protein